ncbi:tetratricopeptide repeat protein [Robertkochia solimangrovi]|uniref:tetratricopeptide repeat protein n=1 Tax=Robertkochia solimangrovi TaxID=2213046 RepID=UPI00117EB2ED|nr:hypothetical protein [Robertkochia solimangrovi]TRZ43141.1 hypothetical protein DMZ48_10635 [Robertkochia solimangrovi]
MKNLVIILTIFISINSFGQIKDVKTIFNEGNDAFQKNNFKKAKEKYLEVISFDKKHKDAHFNLALTELKLNNKETACEYLNKSYRLGVTESYDLITQLCGRLEYSERMWRYDVDELPKFKRNAKFLLLFLETKFTNNRMTSIRINPEFIQFLLPTIKKNKELKSIKGQVNIVFHFDINGQFKIYAINGNIKESQKSQLAFVLKNTTELIPAKYDNKNVALYARMNLPLKF